MKIELKNVKYSEAMSDETNAFTADIWIDGKKALYCKNSGTGGGTSVRRYKLEDREIEDKFFTYCRSLPPVQSKYGPLDSNADLVIDNLFMNWLTDRDCRRAMKNKIVFTIVGKPGIFQVKGKYTDVPRYDVRKHHPTVDQVLNELPIEDAVKLWRRDL